MAIKTLSDGVHVVNVHIRNGGRKQETVYGTKRDARRIETQIRSHLMEMAKCRTGEDITSFGEAMRYYYKNDLEAKNLKGGKDRGYRNRIEAIINLVGPHFPITDRGTIRRQLKAVGNQLLEQQNYGLYKCCKIFTHAAFNVLIDDEVVAYQNNPVTYNLSAIPETLRTSFVVPPDCFAALLHNMPRAYWEILTMSYLVPTRIGELADLRTEDLELKGNAIYIKMSKTGPGRLIPIPMNLLDYVKFVKERSTYLFPLYDHKTKTYLKMNLEKLRYYWEPARDQVGVPQLHIHDLRATAARNLCLAGMKDEFVMIIGGWRNITIFRRFYRRIQDAELVLQFRRAEGVRSAIEAQGKTLDDCALNLSETMISKAIETLARSPTIPISRPETAGRLEREIWAERTGDHKNAA
jgi:integrase